MPPTRDQLEEYFDAQERAAQCIAKAVVASQCLKDIKPGDADTVFSYAAGYWRELVKGQNPG